MVRMKCDGFNFFKVYVHLYVLSGYEILERLFIRIGMLVCYDTASFCKLYFNFFQFASR